MVDEYLVCLLKNLDFKTYFKFIIYVQVGRYEDAANVFSKMFFMNNGEKHPLPREVSLFKFIFIQIAF